MRRAVNASRRPFNYGIDPSFDDYALALQATGADVPITLWDMAQATIAEQRYTRACLDGQLRREAHKHSQYKWSISDARD